MRKRGVPVVNRSGARGDQIVSLRVTIPKSLSVRQKQLLQEAFGVHVEEQEKKDKKGTGFFDFIKSAAGCDMEKDATAEKKAQTQQ